MIANKPCFIGLGIIAFGLTSLAIAIVDRMAR